MYLSFVVWKQKTINLKNGLVNKLRHTIANDRNLPLFVLSEAFHLTSYFTCGKFCSE